MNDSTEICTMKIDTIISFIKEAFNDFPLKEGLDQTYFAYLMLDFADLDIEEEIKGSIRIPQKAF